MKAGVFTRWVVLIFVGVCLSTWARAQSAEAQKGTTSRGTEIAKYFIEEPQKNSGYETGPLHILYSDGTEVVKSLPPLQKSTEKEIVFNDVGFSDVQLAEDRQTLGWTINVENCCTSYSIPLSVVVLRNKHVFHSFDTGQMVWSWMFVRRGEQVAIVFGPTHGPEVGDYRLYDVETGKLKSEVYGDEETQALKPSAPEWAKRLEDQFHSR